MCNIVLTDKPRTGESVPRFKKIPGFTEYGINEEGKIYSYKTNKILSTYIGCDNYEHCVLFKKGRRYRKRVHRLMGKTFLGNPPIVNHIDGNKSNNNLINLERSTNSENVQKAYNNGSYNNSYRVKVKVIDKTTGAVKHCRSMREAQRFSGVGRHRIKLWLDGKSHRPNLTNYIFEFDE